MDADAGVFGIDDLVAEEVFKCEGVPPVPAQDFAPGVGRGGGGHLERSVVLSAADEFVEVGVGAAVVELGDAVAVVERLPGYVRRIALAAKHRGSCAPGVVGAV